MGGPGGRPARTPFAAELERLLARRGLSWRKFATMARYTPGWLSKIKNGAQPSADFARRCDELLEAHGTLMALAGVTQPRPAELPAAIAGFVAREAHLDRLHELLAEPHRPGTSRVAVVEGAPGVGKTALALRWAHDVAHRFPDGQLFADLRGFSHDASPAAPHDVLGELLTALGTGVDVVPLDLARRAALFRSVLADRAVLLVLDNAADADQVQPLLPGSGSCAVVVTSRRALPALALRTHGIRLDVGRLTDAESVELLRQAIGEERMLTDPGAPAKLVERCGHLPLALRIAAEHLISDPRLSVRDLVDYLAEERRTLDVLALDDQVAVRTVFSWSYRCLEEDQRRVLRLISAGRCGEVTTSAVAQQAGISHEQAQHSLYALVTAHMLEHLGGDRYRLHELLRLFAAERVEDSPAPAARRSRVVAHPRIPTSR